MGCDDGKEESHRERIQIQNPRCYFQLFLETAPPEQVPYILPYLPD